MEKNKTILQLNACAAVCNSCFNNCLFESHLAELTRCIQLTRECSEVCQLAAAALARNSENADRYLGLCAEICNICADECGKTDNEFCQQCASVCHRCADMLYSKSTVN